MKYFVDLHVEIQKLWLAAAVDKNIIVHDINLNSLIQGIVKYDKSFNNCTWHLLTYNEIEYLKSKWNLTLPYNTTNLYIFYKDLSIDVTRGYYYKNDIDLDNIGLVRENIYRNIDGYKKIENEVILGATCRS